MSESLYDIAVIGGGASGMMAALSAADTRLGLSIVVLERLNRVGKKLMATGNGRCNLTNLNASERNYHGETALMRPAMRAHPPEDVLRRFRELGVYPLVEEGGRVYPMSEQASSVLDVLHLSMQERNIAEICDFEVKSLARDKRGSYLLTASDGRRLTARRVICASGGLTASKLGGSASGLRLMSALGHTIMPCYPALVQLKTDPMRVRPLKGIKYTGKIELLIYGTVRREETGDVLFTEYGLSGPPVMQLSHIASEAFLKSRSAQVTARLHPLPLTAEETLTILLERQSNFPTRTLENFLTGLINKRLGQTLIKEACALPLSSPAAQLTQAQMKTLSEYLTGWELTITGTQGFEQAQVMAGGVRLDELNSNTMESAKAKGLYLCGEVLDINGDCGGYNLQWAWATGMLAGECCAKSL